MAEADRWVEIVEKAREEIRAAATDREAIEIAFTELARLALDIKADIKDANAHRT